MKWFTMLAELTVNACDCIWKLKHPGKCDKRGLVEIFACRVLNLRIVLFIFVFLLMSQSEE